MAQVELKLTQRLKTKLFFDDEDMDFDFQLFLANLENHGASIGEIFNTARRIDTKNELSWKTEFVKEAERVEALAENCLKKGHRISAGDAFLRAFTYYRSAFMAILPEEDDFKRVYHKSVSCFRRGLDAKAKLIPHEWVTIDYNGYKFPGCFLKADNTDKKRPTITMHNGGDSHSEDHFFMYGQAAIDRGYNCLLWDGPLDTGGRFYEPDATYKTFGREELTGAYRAAVDMLIARPDVDPDRLILTGESYGGAKTMFNATIDDRFAAVIPNSPIYSAPKMVRFMNENLPVFEGVTKEESNALLNKMPFFSRNTLKTLIWYNGFDSLLDWIPAAEELFETDCKKITAPFLAMYSESENTQFCEQAEYAYKHVSSKIKDIIKTTVAEGADLHCQVNNYAKSQQVMFDWLDELLDYQVEK